MRGSTMRFLSDMSITITHCFYPLNSLVFLIFACFVFLPGSEKEDFYDQIPVMLREMLYRLNDDDAAVLKANHAALTALSNKVSAEELVQHVEFMKNLIASMVSESRRRKGGVGDGEFLLPGFNIPKGRLSVVHNAEHAGSTNLMTLNYYVMQRVRLLRGVFYID